MWRSISDYRRNLGKIHRYVWYFLKACLLFKRPWQFLRHYLTRTSPPSGMLELRDGLKIYLSSHPHDIITVFVIFVRQDYGTVPQGSVVVDIGANIGVFSLYAAHRGARKVDAYEPNAASFECMRRSIEANGLEGRIIPWRMAVSGVAGKMLHFPVASSVYNRAVPADCDAPVESVLTTSLREILETNKADPVDLLKMDCEGAEYEILFSSATPHFDRIRSIRMEYHGGREQELIRFLEQHEFETIRYQRDSDLTGNLWFAQRAGAGLS